MNRKRAAIERTLREGQDANDAIYGITTLYDSETICLSGNGPRGIQLKFRPDVYKQARRLLSKVWRMSAEAEWGEAREGSRTNYRSALGGSRGARQHGTSS